MSKTVRVARQKPKNLHYYWTIPDVANALSVSEGKAREFIFEHDIPTTQYGGQQIVRKDAIVSALDKIFRQAKEEEKMKFKATERWVREAFSKAKASARKRDIPFSLTMEDIAELAAKQRGCCAVTGKRFNAKTIGASNKRPWMTSVDRIDSYIGYTKDNVRLVSIAANLAMGAWGEEVLYEMARAICNNRKDKLRRNQKLSHVGGHVGNLNGKQVSDNYLI